eukprot:scaffold231172_cov48-Attheya_sp.AAC.1
MSPHIPASDQGCQAIAVQIDAADIGTAKGISSFREGSGRIARSSHGPHGKGSDRTRLLIALFYGFKGRTWRIPMGRP